MVSLMRGAAMNFFFQFNKLVLLVCVLIAGAMCAAVSAAPPDDLQGVEIDDIFLVMTNEQGNYTVINARMDETATAAVFFGIAGAVANSAINNSQDEEMASRWSEVAARLDISGLLEASFLETLNKSQAVSVAPDKDGASHTLRIALKDWGLIRRNRESGEFRAFINVNVLMTDKKKKTVWRSYPNRVGKFVSADLEDFSDDVFERELTTLAQRVGQNIAYEIIYR